MSEAEKSRGQRVVRETALEEQDRPSKPLLSGRGSSAGCLGLLGLLGLLGISHNSIRIFFIVLVP